MGSDRMKMFATRHNDKAELLLSLFIYFCHDIRFGGVTKTVIQFQTKQSVSSLTLGLRESLKS